MGRVYTTSEDLTSVANAIRAKTGDDSALVYPTGFVSAIQGIQYDWRGENVTLVKNILDETITLADTDFPNITPSTSTSVILPEVSLTSEKVYRPMTSEELLMIYTLYVKFAYKSGYTPISAFDEQYEVYTIRAARRPTQLSDLTYKNYFTTIATNFSEFGIYFNNSGTDRGIEWGNNSGVYMNCSIGTSNSDLVSQPAVGITPRSPSIRFAASNSYMTTTASNNVDAANTTIHYTLDMYVCSINSTASGMTDSVVDLYQAVHAND